eukprot:364197-Chlamydomonas_euryale.AAC.53
MDKARSTDRAIGATPQRIQSQSQSYREPTHEGYACVECSKTEGIKQRAVQLPQTCHKGNAGALGLHACRLLKNTTKGQITTQGATAFPVSAPTRCHPEGSYDTIQSIRQQRAHSWVCTGHAVVPTTNVPASAGGRPPRGRATLELCALLNAPQHNDSREGLWRGAASNPPPPAIEDGTHCMGLGHALEYAAYYVHMFAEFVSPS